MLIGRVIVMHKFKKVLGYVLGFVGSVFLTMLLILTILKGTIFNQEYVLKKLDDNNYYEEVTTSIRKDMEYSLLSSGIDKSVLTDIFKDGDVKVDIKNYVSSIYTGSKYKTKTSSIKEKLNNNIDEYLKENDLEVSDGSSLDSYVTGISKIYKDGIEMYGYFNGFVSSFVKAIKLIDVLIGLSLMFVILDLVILKKVLHRRFLGVICLSSSLMLLFIRYYVYEGIDFKNILIISDSFSKVIRKTLIDVGDKMIVMSMVLLLLSIIFNYICSMRKVKRIKKSH